MSYNGVGLGTARGSGTSGYVTSNKFHRTGSRLRREEWKDLKELHAGSQGTRKPDAEILEHNRRREIEAKLMQLEDDLEEEGTYTEGEIQEHLKEARAKFEQEAIHAKSKATRKDDTHAIAARKAEKMDDLRKAFGISHAKANREGDAFDRDLQQQLKEKRRMEHEEQVRQREEERGKEMRKREKAQKKAEKEAREMRRIRNREEKHALKEKKRAEKRKHEEVDRGRSRSRSGGRDRRKDHDSQSPSRSRSPRRRHDSDDEDYGAKAARPSAPSPVDKKYKRDKKKRRRRSPSSSSSSSSSSSDS